MRIICAFLFLFTVLYVGAVEPTNPLLPDLDGIAQRPLDPSNKLASVIIFFSQDCPISNGYVPEINRISSSHTNFSFFIVQVDRDLTVTTAKAHAKEYALHPPVLLDSQHQLVKFLKPSVTPEVFVVGRMNQILYQGRIDNQWAEIEKKRGVVTERNLRDALEAIALGKSVKQKETRAVGCVVQP